MAVTSMSYNKLYATGAVSNRTRRGIALSIRPCAPQRHSPLPRGRTQIAAEASAVCFEEGRRSPAAPSRSGPRHGMPQGPHPGRVMGTPGPRPVRATTTSQNAHRPRSRRSTGFGPRNVYDHLTHGPRERPSDSPTAPATRSDQEMRTLEELRHKELPHPLQLRRSQE